MICITLPVDCVRVVDTLIVTVEDENVDVSPVICGKSYLSCSFQNDHTFFFNSFPKEYIIISYLA